MKVSAELAGEFRRLCRADRPAGVRMESPDTIAKKEVIL